MDIYVQQGGIYTLTEELVRTLFHHGRVTAEGRSACGTALGPDFALAVDMGTAAGSAVLNIT